MRDMKFYGINEFKFDDTRLKELIALQNSLDKKLFNMDVSHIEWGSYFLGTVKGFIRHILKDSDDHIGRQKYKK